MRNMKVQKANTILVPLDSFLYLHGMCSWQRTGKNLSEKRRKMLTRSFERLQKDGFREVMDYDFGGCSWPYENGFEEGRWTSWSCEDMKRILQSAGYSYLDGEATEYIAVSM